MIMFIVSLVSINLVKADNQITTDAEIDQQTQDVVQNDVVNDPDLANVGTTPDQAGYGLKLALEKIRFALTFNRAKKAELSLQLAELRIKEARLMAAKNNLEGVERAKVQYQNHLEKAKDSLDKLNNDQDSFKNQATIQARLDADKNQVDEFESFILVKTQGLTEEQRQKLLSLIEEFKAQNENVELKILNKREILKTRLKAQGRNETDIEDEFENESNQTRNLTKEDVLMRKANHQYGQAEKMYNLASRLIDKFQNRFNVNETNATVNGTLNSRTLELHAKAKAELDQAKVELDVKNYFKSVEHSRSSKKLSALTIATIHGGNRSFEERLEKIEDREDKIKEHRDEIKSRIEDLKDKRKNLMEELRNKKNEKEAWKSPEDRGGIRVPQDDEVEANTNLSVNASSP